MRTKLFFLVPLVFLTACNTITKDPVHNPQGLNNEDLVKTQIAKIEALQRENDRREQELKMQHLKELHQVQTRAAQSVPQTVNTNCRFLCF
jgi:hypothetical protein